jgi:hypothetical protein
VPIKQCFEAPEGKGGFELIGKKMQIIANRR